LNFLKVLLGYFLSSTVGAHHIKEWIMKSLIFTVITIFAGNVFAASNCDSDANYPEITKAELQKIIDEKKAVIIDVNSKASFDKERIPGAVHFESQKNVADVLPKSKDDLIVAYCGGTMCTAWKKAAVAACKLNYKNIKHFKPGIKGWMQKDA
jgi:rhodanese-related sulfurtransferase